MLIMVTPSGIWSGGRRARWQCACRSHRPGHRPRRPGFRWRRPRTPRGLLPGWFPLEEALEVFEVFASGTLADEVYVLDDVSGKRIAIAPAALRTKYRKE